MRAPDYHKGNTISGYWTGSEYLCSHPVPLYNLSWPFLYHLIKLKLLGPRGNKFKLGILDYGYDD